MRLMTFALLAGLLGTAACATAGSEGRRSRNYDTIEAEEIQAAGPRIRTAFDAVEQLRPRFLRTRANPTVGVGAARADPVVVYVDGTRWGGIRSLERIRADEVMRIHYVRPTDAQTRYGNGHGSGVLEVTTHQSRNGL